MNSVSKPNTGLAARWSQQAANSSAFETMSCGRSFIARVTSSVLPFAHAPAAVHGQDGAGNRPGGVAAQKDGRLGTGVWRNRTGDDWLLAPQVRCDGRVLHGPRRHRRSEERRGGEE